MAELAWRAATAADIAELYPRKPFETLRALVITVDGKPSAILGLAHEPDRERAFSEYRAELAPYLKRLTVLRAIMAFMEWVRAARVPVYAVSEGTGLLERLGFIHVDGDLFVWRNCCN